MKKFFVVYLGIIKQASELAVCESICSFCSRMKRGRLYACARRHGYNVLAIGQHLDDIAERFEVFHYFLIKTLRLWNVHTHSCFKLFGEISVRLMSHSPSLIVFRDINIIFR